MSLDVLAIAAHPDDVEQTCGGTLLRMAEMGYRTGVLDLTAGDMGTRGSPEQRVAESEVAARHLQLKLRGNLHMPDARLENNIMARMTLAVKIRELKPRVVILPYWQARHPDHYRAAEIGFEACFLSGLRKLDEYSEPHRPFKILYASVYADVRPSFIVDISAQFERRMAALLSYTSQYGEMFEGGALFPQRAGDPRAAGGGGALLRQPDRRQVRRAVRGEGSHPDRRHRRHAVTLDLSGGRRRGV